MTNLSNIMVIPHRGEQRTRDGTHTRAIRELLDDEWIVETPPFKKGNISRRDEAKDRGISFVPLSEKGGWLAHYA